MDRICSKVITLMLKVIQHEPRSSTSEATAVDVGRAPAAQLDRDEPPLQPSVLGRGLLRLPVYDRLCLRPRFADLL